MERRDFLEGDCLEFGDEKVELRVNGILIGFIMRYNLICEVCIES